MPTTSPSARHALAGRPDQATRAATSPTAPSNAFTRTTPANQAALAGSPSFCPMKNPAVSRCVGARTHMSHRKMRALVSCASRSKARRPSASNVSSGCSTARILFLAARSRARMVLPSPLASVSRGSSAPQASLACDRTLTTRPHPFAPTCRRFPLNDLGRPREEEAGIAARQRLRRRPGSQSDLMWRSTPSSRSRRRGFRRSYAICTDPSGLGRARVTRPPAPPSGSPRPPAAAARRRSGPPRP